MRWRLGCVVGGTTETRVRTDDGRGRRVERVEVDDLVPFLLRSLLLLCPIKRNLFSRPQRPALRLSKRDAPCPRRDADDEAAEQETTPSPATPRVRRCPRRTSSPRRGEALRLSPSWKRAEEERLRGEQKRGEATFPSGGSERLAGLLGLADEAPFV